MQALPSTNMVINKVNQNSYINLVKVTLKHDENILHVQFILRVDYFLL